MSKCVREIVRKILATDQHLDKKKVLRGVESAAKYGDLELLKILLKHPNADKSWIDAAVKSATIEGRLDVLIFIRENYLEPFKKELIVKPAVEHARCDIMEYMIKEKILSVGDFLGGCSTYSQKIAFDYIVDNFVKKYGNGPIDILTKVLLQNESWLDKTLEIPNLVFDERILENSTRQTWESDPIDILKVLKHPGAPITETLLCRAFANHSVTVDEAKSFFDRAPNLVPTVTLMDSVVHKDRAELFKYITARFCLPKDVYKCLSSAMGADEAMFDTILEKGNFNEALLKEAIDFTASNYQNRGKYLTKMLAKLKNFKVEPVILKSMDHLAHYSKPENRSKMQEDQVLDLLKFPGVDLAHQTQFFLRRACENGWNNIVNYLLESPKVIPSVMDNVCIRSASSQGHLDVVQKLLADPRVNPAAFNNHAIQCAVLGDHIEVIKALIADPRVNPAANDNYAYKKAKSQAVKDLLLQNELVKVVLAAKK